MAESNPEDDNPDFFEDFEFSPNKEIKCILPPKKNIDNEDASIEESAATHPDALLEPNHPLLERFQKALKEHLLKVIERFKEDVAELENGTKQKNHEREQIGVETYDMQQTVIKQQKEIEEYANELQTIAAAKEQMDHEVGELTKKYKEEKNRLIEAEKKEIELRNEVESTNLLIDNMTKWEKDVESELVINQRMAEKTRKDKMKLATQKKQQDMLVYKLMTEVWRLESELETIMMQLRVKEEEREAVAETLFMTNIDVEANEADHRCLLHGWQALLVTIGNKDKYYNKSMEEYKLLEDKLTAVKCELVQVKKFCNQELLRNETLTVFKERIDVDIKNANRMLALETEKRTGYEKIIMQYDSIAEQIEKDILRVKTENNQINSTLKSLTKSHTNLSNERIKLEGDIMSSMHDGLLKAKYAKKFQNTVKQEKEDNRNIRINLCCTESNIAKVEAEIHNLEYENQEFTRMLGELQKQLSVEDGELERCDKEIDMCEREMLRLGRVHETLTSKLEKFTDIHNSQLSPHEIKIQQLEGNIVDTQCKNKEMQNFWMREQAIVVDLAEKRQNQIKEMTILEKQISILDQKNLKINDELDSYEQEEAIINRNIYYYANKLSACTETLFKKKGSKEFLDDVNNSTQIDLMAKLEDSEIESLKLKSDISEIEEDKVTLSNELIEKNREALHWEKKIQLVLEAKKNMDEDTSNDGEIGRMKTEIHRMNVRYAQLRKAQDKLMVDLEHCVTRRESIVNLSEARQRCIKDSSHYMRLTFSRKLIDMKNKLQQTLNDKETVEKKIEGKLCEIDRTQEEIDIVEEEIRNLKKQVQTSSEAIDNKRIDKQLNLDILLFKQRKLKVYLELARGRQPFTIHKTTSLAHTAYEREKIINSRLRTVIENLLTDFPNHGLFLTKSHNSLVLPSLSL